MNAFIKSFSDKYLYSKKGIDKDIPWFDDQEFEQILESAKNVVSKYLSEKGCKWVLESSSFADDIEEVISLCMAYNCMSRLIDNKNRSKKIKKDNRLSGVFDSNTIDLFKNYRNEHDNNIIEAFSKIISKAEQSPEKPNQYQF